MSESANIFEKANRVLEKHKVAVFVVAYNASKHLESVLKRIPDWIAEKLTEVYIIDDHSSDETFDTAKRIEWSRNFAPLQIYRTPHNQGYGGNQCLGYKYAIQKEFDIVVLLHGDGQYAPEALADILAPYDNGADAVFGSRFLDAGAALSGGMPLYKWVGNRILTWTQNKLLGTQLSEMHSGYRSYRVSSLQEVPFHLNSKGFDFDADIIVQFVEKGLKIVEVPIPTYYGDEICHVNGLQYAWKCIRAFVGNKLMKYELFYDPKFDFQKRDVDFYTSKKAPTSIHAHIRNIKFKENDKVLDIGGGDGVAVSEYHAEQGVDITCIDQYLNQTESKVSKQQVDLERSLKEQFDIQSYDAVFALDVIEHLSDPEQRIEEWWDYISKDGKLYVSTGNVAFIITRLMLFLGQFNYGKRGILDMTHKRLFTLSSFCRLLENAGFIIERKLGFGVPLKDLKPDSEIFSFLDQLSFFLARFYPRLFAYQILLECRRPNSIQELMKQTFEDDE